MDKVIVLPIRGNRIDNGSIPLEDRDDDTLMLTARAGDTRAFETLVRRHQRMALSTATKYLGDPSAAEDAAQNSFIDLLRCVPSYRPDGKFRAFFARIVINQCKMTNRRARSEATKKHGVYTLQYAAPEVDNEVLRLREQRRQIEEALCGVSPKLREVLILRYTADLSLKEIGDTLGIRLGTVKSRLFAGIEKLGRALEAMER